MSVFLSNNQFHLNIIREYPVLYQSELCPALYQSELSDNDLQFIFNMYWTWKKSSYEFGVVNLLNNGPEIAVYKITSFEISTKSRLYH